MMVCLSRGEWFLIAPELMTFVMYTTVGNGLTLLLLLFSTC